MNKKIYKGLEIMEMISKGKIAEHQKFNFENNNFYGDVEYYNGTLYWLVYDEEWNLKDKNNLFDMFNIQSTMVADFEFVEDNIEEIEELEIDENNYIHTKDGAWKGRKMDLAFAKIINKLIENVKEMKEGKE